MAPGVTSALSYESVEVELRTLGLDSCPRVGVGGAAHSVFRRRTGSQEIGDGEPKSRRKPMTAGCAVRKGLQFPRSSCGAFPLVRMTGLRAGHWKIWVVVD